MLPLAQWIMRGRVQTFGFVLLALLTSPILWPNGILACSALALIGLRAEFKDSFLLLLWALLLTVSMAYFFNSFMPILLVLTTSFASGVLKKTGSWSLTLMSLSACSMLASLSLENFAKDSLDVYVTDFDRFLTEMKRQFNQPDVQAILPSSIGTVFIAGLFGSMVIIGGFFSVVLARSWQAKLYNPGGFQIEFHGLRLSKIESLISLIFIGIFFELGSQYLSWVWLVLFPLLVAGIALFHATAEYKKLTLHWYFIFYAVLILWDPLKIFLVGLAFADSFFNFRNKYTKPTIDQGS